MSLTSQTTIGNVISAIKKYRNHEESEFGREEKNNNLKNLSPFFGGEKDPNTYRSHLVNRGCHYREEKIASYIIDVLLDQNKESKFTKLRNFQEVNEIISLTVKNGGGGNIMPILKHQKKMIQDLFTCINGLEDIEYGVKTFIHRTNKELRSEGFEQFWYLSNDNTMQKSINTKLFWHKVESTLASLPTKLLHEANDDIITLFIKQQLNILSQGKKQLNYAVGKDAFNGVYDTEKGIIKVINTAPNNTDNIIILREGGEHTLITQLNSSKYPGLYREIKHIQNIFIHHEGFQTFFGGKVTMMGSEKEYLFNGTTLIERLNKQEIEAFDLILNDRAILATLKSQNGALKKLMFVRKNFTYERLQITHYCDPSTKENHFIDSIIEVDGLGGKIYARVLSKSGVSKKIHVLPFENLKSSPVSTN